MSVINGSLFGGVVKFHQPESHSSSAVIVIDEMNAKGASGTVENCHEKTKPTKKTAVVCSGTKVLAHVVL